MNIEEKERLAHKGDAGYAAAAIRLLAARLAIGMETQKQLAEACGRSQAAIGNAEAGSNYPSREVLLYLYRAHRIDLNFMFIGDFAQLPGDVQDRLFPALVTANDQWDRKPDAGQRRAKE